MILGFVITHVDNSLYVLYTQKCIFITIIYVDDLIVTCNDVSMIKNVKLVISKQFDMKDLGELRYFLGIEVMRVPHGIWMIQR